MNNKLANAINEATEVIWLASKGKERCPRKIIHGQLKWISDVATKELKQEYEEKLKQLRAVRADEFAEVVMKKFAEQGVVEKDEQSSL